MSIERPSCFFNLCSSCSSRSNKRRRDCLLPPPRGRLCCRAGLTAPPYSHCWPSHPSTHPHLLLFSGDGRRTSKPSYSRTPLRVGNNCRVFPASVAGCAAAKASPPPTIPTTGQALQRRQPHTAAEPVNPRTHLRAGFHCRVFPGSASSPS